MKLFGVLLLVIDAQAFVATLPTKTPVNAFTQQRSRARHSQVRPYTQASRVRPALPEVSMCGILAVYNSAMSHDELRLKTLQLQRSVRHRGPDGSGIHTVCTIEYDNEDEVGRCHAIAHERLAIVDPAGGDQPLYSHDHKLSLAVNGEIYNHKQLRAGLKDQTAFHTGSDCEVIVHLYKEVGNKVTTMLDGDFAFVIVDEDTGDIFAARDPIGVNSMYIGYGADGSVWFASEMKAIAKDCERVQIFPPGHYYSTKDGGGFVKYYDPAWQDLQLSRVPKSPISLDKLRGDFITAVEKRLMSDVPYGVLLSGGLDSSLVASVASKIRRQRGQEHLKTFCIGLEGSPDLEAAQKVADFIGTDHYGFTFTVQEGIDAVSDVIYHLETYDVTTIRAGTPMFLLSRSIKAMGVNMVLSGEGSDESLAGYLYFHKAPSPEELHLECVSKMSALHQFDCLRANKATMAWGLEVRVPFLDKAFMETTMSTDPALKMTDTSLSQGEPQYIEKWLIRQAFDESEAGEKYLPAEVLWRQKEQFSDGVGYDWIDRLKEFSSRIITDDQMASAAARFPINTPTTKEAYYIRHLFHSHFPQWSAPSTVPGGPTIACSTATAIKWDEAWAKMADPSGRAVDSHKDAVACI